jgi:hypothetical protein
MFKNYRQVNLIIRKIKLKEEINFSIPRANYLRFQLDNKYLKNKIKKIVN